MFLWRGWRNYSVDRLGIAYDAPASGHSIVCLRQWTERLGVWGQFSGFVDKGPDIGSRVGMKWTFVKSAVTYRFDAGLFCTKIYPLRGKCEKY